MAVTLASLDKAIAVILERIKGICRDLEEKHTQNRNSIHELHSLLQNLVDEIWKLKIKMAVYAVLSSVVSGAITTIVVKQIEKVIGR